MGLAQAVSDLGLRIRARGPRGLGLGLAADLLRAVLIRAGDPPVRHEVGGVLLEMPLSHQFPYHRLAHPQYGTQIARLAAAVERKYPGASVVDIGANVGDTAALVRSACRSPILCIEGDPDYLATLRRNAALLPDVHVEEAFVGGATGTLRAHLAVGGGTGRLVAGGETTVELQTLEALLARRPSLTAPHLVKIDTDGFDAAIIDGSVGVWVRLRPVIFFEYDPAFLAPGFDAPAFFARLAAAGYERVLVYENTGDFLVALRLLDAALLEDLHHFYSGRRTLRYADLAVFHAQDADLAEAFRRAELAHFDRARAR